jgi:hypothetical protein
MTLDKCLDECWREILPCLLDQVYFLSQEVFPILEYKLGECIDYFNYIACLNFVLNSEHVE